MVFSHNKIIYCFVKHLEDVVMHREWADAWIYQFLIRSFRTKISFFCMSRQQFALFRGKAGFISSNVPRDLSRSDQLDLLVVFEDIIAFTVFHLPWKCVWVRAADGHAWAYMSLKIEGFQKRINVGGGRRVVSASTLFYRREKQVVSAIAPHRGEHREGVAGTTACMSGEAGNLPKITPCKSWNKKWVSARASDTGGKSEGVVQAGHVWPILCRAPEWCTRQTNDRSREHFITNQWSSYHLSLISRSSYVVGAKEWTRQICHKIYRVIL